MASRIRFSRDPAEPMARLANGSASAVRRNFRRKSACSSLRSGASRLFVRHLVNGRESQFQIASLRGVPRRQQRRQEREVCAVAATLQQAKRAVDPTPSDLVSHQQEPTLGRQLSCRDFRRHGQRQIGLTCAEGFQQCLAGKIDLIGLRLSKSCQEHGRAHMVATQRRSACLDIRPSWIGGDRCGCRHRGKCESREAYADEQFTCSGNLGLRRLPE